MWKEHQRKNMMNSLFPSQMMKRSDFKARKEAIKTFNAENKNLRRGLAAIPVKFAISLGLKMFHQVNTSLLTIFLSLFVL